MHSDTRSRWLTHHAAPTRSYARTHTRCAAGSHPGRNVNSSPGRSGARAPPPVPRVPCAVYSGSKRMARSPCTTADVPGRAPRWVGRAGLRPSVAASPAVSAARRPLGWVRYANALFRPCGYRRHGGAGVGGALAARSAQIRPGGRAERALRVFAPVDLAIPRRRGREGKEGEVVGGRSSDSPASRSLGRRFRSHTTASTRRVRPRYAQAASLFAWLAACD